jgi:hypothetical protein
MNKSIKGYSTFAILSLIISVINFFSLMSKEIINNDFLFFIFLFIEHFLIIIFIILAFIHVIKFKLNGLLLIICGTIITLFTSFVTFYSFLVTGFL